MCGEPLPGLISVKSTKTRVSSQFCCLSLNCLVIGGQVQLGQGTSSVSRSTAVHWSTGLATRFCFCLRWECLVCAGGSGVKYIGSFPSKNLISVTPSMTWPSALESEFLTKISALLCHVSACLSSSLIVAFYPALSMALIWAFHNSSAPPVILSWLMVKDPADKNIIHVLIFSKRGDDQIRGFN